MATWLALYTDPPVGLVAWAGAEPADERMTRHREESRQSSALRNSSRSKDSNRLQRRDQSVDVQVELERRAAAERKARRKTYGIESEEGVDVEEEGEQFKVGADGSDGLSRTDRGKGVDKGFRNPGGSTDVTDPTTDVSTGADENSRTDHGSTLVTSSGDNTVKEDDDSLGVCGSGTDKASGRDVKPGGKLKTAWCMVKVEIRIILEVVRDTRSYS